MFAKIAALVAHEAHTRLVAPVLAEYRKLGAPAACDRPHVADRAYDVASTTGAQVERAAQWDHDKQPPVTAGRRCGFRAP